MAIHQVAGPITLDISWQAILPLLAVLLPVFGSLLVLLLRHWEKVRNACVVLVTFLDFVLVLLMYRPVLSGLEHNGHLFRYLEYRLPTLLDLGINFKVDTVSLLIGLATSFIWFLSCVYATSYISTEHAQNRYYFFALLTLSANLGVLFTQDFFSLFLFFELLAIFSFVLVIHEETREAYDAGYLYLIMSILGGLALLAGIVLMSSYTGTVEIKPLSHLIEKTMPTSIRNLMVILMFVGFGTKAGVFFLHIWLPEAHPIAPTPASALLSGIMIKAGAYGILRTFNTLFAPTGGVASSNIAHAAEGGFIQQSGYWLIWLGVVTMFFGVVNALLSANCKRMLAYSSISQMGYIVLGLGCASFLGSEGAMGLTGALYHIVNHALFKSLLFLSIGAVYFRTRELDMYKLGGLGRNMPFVAATCFIAAMGYAGVPLFNGFASKTILHHAIIEASEHASSLNHLLLPLNMAEVFFCLTAFGSFCVALKMWLLVFTGKRPKKFKEIKSAPLSMKIALGTISTFILLMGLRPNWLLEKFIGPALADFGFNPSSHAYHIIYNPHLEKGIKSTIPLLYNPKTLSLLQPQVIENLLACGLVILGGGMMFILGHRFKLFYVTSPEWISVKYWYTVSAKGSIKLISHSSYAISKSVDDFYLSLGHGFLEIPFQAFRLRRKVKNEVVPVFLGLPEKTQISLWKDELTNFFEIERRDNIRRFMRQCHLQLIKDGMRAQECWEKLQDEKDEAYKETSKIIELEEEIIKDVEKSMVIAGVGRARRRERLLDLLKLLSEIRKSSEAVNSYKRMKAVSQVISQISAEKSKSMRKNIVVAFAQEIKEKVAVQPKEKEFWEIIVNKTVEEITQAESAYRRLEIGFIERAAGWFGKIARIASEVLTEERVPWEVERYVSQREVAEARAAIRRYTRDMSLNLLLIVLLIVFVATLILVSTK